MGLLDVNDVSEFWISRLQVIMYQ